MSHDSHPIFLCYRWDDNWKAQFFYSRLSEIVKERCHRERVIFFDVDQPIGATLSEKIRRGLDGCRLMIVLVGKTFLTPPNRLLQPSDWVRQEIESHLKDPNKRLIPVLIDQAEKPLASDLPPELIPLLDCEFLTLDIGDRDHGVWMRICRAICQEIGPPPWRRFLMEVFWPLRVRQ